MYFNFKYFQKIYVHDKRMLGRKECYAYRVVRLDVCLHTYFLYSSMIVYVFLLYEIKSTMVWVIDSFDSQYANFTLMFIKENVEKFFKLYTLYIVIYYNYILYYNYIKLYNFITIFSFLNYITTYARIFCCIYK